MTPERTGSDRLDAQLAFLLEIDRLKLIERRSYITDASRRENSAEHSWHLAMLALVLSEHASDEVDAARVIAMVLVHDIVEIDAGDVFAYADEAAHAAKVERERSAAKRIFALLPDDQEPIFRELWEEYEEGTTETARFAAALDRLQPLLLNIAAGGATWREHGITADRVLERNAHISDGAPMLWARARELIRDAVEQGIVDADPGAT
ncbi:MAG: HD domain-containing protein [Acidimicrobiia bacterium]